ncbi:MAG: LacI family transcriptional regulator [Armatimonadetes bacterium]|nr:LacI family transcriptional regulator [Armatimonadota bacterium]
MVTLRDVAEAAGVSVTTASVVLSGKADERGIALATRKKILEAAGRLHFSHNPMARALRTGRSNLIGIVGVRLDEPIPIANIRQTTGALLEHGYDISLHDFAWQRNTRNGQSDLHGRRVDGLIVIPPVTDDALQLLRRIASNHVPVVALDEIALPEADIVTVDREDGAHQLTRHLLELGHKRVAFNVASGEVDRLLSARLRGYLKAHQEMGVAVDECLLLERAKSGSMFADGMDFVLRLLNLKDPPTAIFCSNDQIAIGALRALFEAGKRVPDDISLAGFNGTEDTEYTVVPLTTVQQPIVEAVEVAVSTLMERLNNGESDYHRRKTVISPKLIVRRSTGPAPA